MACNTCSTCDNNTCCQNGIFDPSNLMFFFVALCALSGGNCGNLGNLSNGFGNLNSNELLLFFLMLALLAGNGNLFNNSSCGTC